MEHHTYLHTSTTWFFWYVQSYQNKKRLDILINKTREEVAKDYVTREQLSKELERLIDTLDRIDNKIDNLQSKTYFQE